MSRVLLSSSTPRKGLSHTLGHSAESPCQKASLRTRRVLGTSLRPRGASGTSWWPPSSKLLEAAIYLEKHSMQLFSESILYVLLFFYLVLYRQILHGYQKNNLYTYFFHYCNFLKKHYDTLLHRSIQPMYFHEVCKTVHWVDSI